VKVAFFHDAPLFFSNDGNVYSIGFDYSVWQRYLKVFDKMIVCTRFRNDTVDDNNRRGMKLSNGPNVEFKPIDKYKKNFDALTNYKSISLQIREALQLVDCAIIRLPSTIGMLAYKEALNLGKPFAVEVVGCPWDALWNYGNIIGKVAAPIFYVITKKIIKNSKYTIYVTKNFLQKRYPTYGISSYCSNVNIPNTTVEVLENRISRTSMLAMNNVIKLGMIGALGSKFKGFDLAIEATSILLKSYKNIELHILGPGDKSRWEAYARKQGIANRVYFDGILPNGEEVYSWLDNIDIYIQPSKQEGLPRALIEAMSRGCPAIGSRTAGIPELLEEEVIHKKGNSKDLAQKIEKLILDSSLRIEQAKKNFYKSKEYIKDVLDERRLEFWLDFRKCVMEHQSEHIRIHQGAI
jgi:glycosyltransferase involved in cell wall biosynthesis